MPLYDYQCKGCGHDEIDVVEPAEPKDKLVCGKCGEVMSRLLPAPRLKFFPEGMWEHLDINPIHISSAGQLKEECKKHGCYAKYLDTTSKPGLDEV